MAVSDQMQFSLHIDGSPNCLAVNRDCNMLVAAGRTIFKVFSIDDDKFTEKLNLRSGRTLNLNFSAADVTWNPSDDNLLASAATNGAVVVWDLNRVQRSKQERVFNEHRRSVNRVTFHPQDSHLLMSGAQDGLMKLFDLRNLTVVHTFCHADQTESVRDVQFNPFSTNVFAAGFDNGNIQLWDIRYPNRWERQFTAHNGPVFSIDWHPDDRNWLATAGRDKIVKVWETMFASKAKNIYTVQTIASVARIRWRPQHKYQLASCALLVDFSINIWDLKRPFIPFAAFSEHKDVVTGIVWKASNPEVFFTSSKDQTICKHLFKNGSRPVKNANPVGLDININGSVIQAVSEKINTVTGKGHSLSQNKLSMHFRKNALERSDQSGYVKSLLTEFQHLEESLSMTWFIKSATGYWLTGRPLADLCDHNKLVADDLSRPQISQTWLILKHLFVGATHSGTKYSSMGVEKSDRLMRSDLEPESKTTYCHRIERRNISNDSATDMSAGEDEGNFSDADVTGSILLFGVGNYSSQMADQSCLFGDTEESSNLVEAINLDSINNELDLPAEAFNPRCDIDTNHPNVINRNVESITIVDSSTNDSESSLSVTQVSVPESAIKQEILDITPFSDELPLWSFTGSVCDMLCYYAEQGDVQTAVSIILVLGDLIRPSLNESLVEQWFSSYIDMLSRFQLWSVATEIIRLCNIPAISSLNLHSTVINSSCKTCGKPLVRSGWICDRCKNEPLRNFLISCSICHLPVKGLFLWCQGCSHGGHMQHIRSWLSKRRYCPTGCGHQCEYT